MTIFKGFNNCYILYRVISFYPCLWVLTRMFKEDASFFLCKELVPGYLDGITGEYATPEGYLVDEREAEEFDKQFPYKEKKKLPGQIF